jgi:hypothetical protein
MEFAISLIVRMNGWSVTEKIVKNGVTSKKPRKNVVKGKASGKG